MITVTGKGLGIAIDCECLNGCSWMAFSLWWSIHKLLPEAKVAVALRRGITGGFVWPSHVHVPLLQHSGVVGLPCLRDCEQVLVLPPHVVAIRTNIDFWGPESARSEKIMTFADYQEGVGRFVLASWINTLEPPFGDAMRRFATPEMTTNEKKVLAHWQSCESPYASFA